MHSEQHPTRCIFYSHFTLSDSVFITSMGSRQTFADSITARVREYASRLRSTTPNEKGKRYTQQRTPEGRVLIPSSFICSHGTEDANSDGTNSSAFVLPLDRCSECSPLLEADSYFTHYCAVRRDIITHVNGASTTDYTDAHINPLVLPVGAAVSMMGSFSVYDDLTTCHCWDHVTDTSVLTMWDALVRLVAEDIFSIGEGHPGRHVASVVRGVFVYHASPFSFTLGVITSGTPANVDVLDFLENAQLLVNCSISRFFQVVPIGEKLRRVKLRLWWTPNHDRVVPHSSLAKIKVIMEDTRYGIADIAQFAASTYCGPFADSPFKGYRSVRVFLSRPMCAALQGVTTRAIPHTLQHAWGSDGGALLHPFPNNTPSVGNTPQCSDITKAFAGEMSASVDGRLHHSISATALAGMGKFVDEDDAVVFMRSCTAQCTVFRTHMYFDELAVGSCGEHLLCVEAQVSRAFQPFVPVVCGHFAPFLVVDRDTA